MDCSPTQFVPYYINGLIPLSYQLPDDQNLRSLRELYMGTILKTQNLSGSPAADWLGPHVGSPLEYWPKYLAVEAVESYAEALDPSARAPVIEALVAHHRQFWAQASAGAPAFNESKWGFARYSDAIVGIQWLLDAGQGDTADTAFLWDLMRLIRTQSDGVMAAVSEADGGGYSWESWFERGDPFLKANDGEKTKSVHLRRHGAPHRPRTISFFFPG